MASDGTRSFAAGDRTWGTLLALEIDGEIAVANVSARGALAPDRVACLPTHDVLTSAQRRAVEQIANGVPTPRPWSHQNAVAEGELDACIWYAGDVWDHAAPSLLVEEAGGRFSDHASGNRRDTRTAVYSNGRCHDDALDLLDRRR